MKNFLTLILLLFLSVPLFANEKIIEQVDVNKFYYIEYDDNGNFIQEGYYKKVNGEFVPHGLWKNFNGTKGKYENGTLVWIQPHGHQKYSRKDIYIGQLELRLQRLEEKLASN